MAQLSRVLACIFLLFCSIGIAAESPSQSTGLLLVSVLDPSGKAVPDLAKDNFFVKVDGRRVGVVDASYSFALRRIVVVLDMSSSMAGQTDDKKWRISREALEALLADAPAGVPTALLTFSDQVHEVFDLSQGRDSLTKWLKEEPGRQARIQVHGKTALYDAIAAAIKQLAPARPGDAIYVITDGYDTGSHISDSAVRNLLLRSETRLFSFLLVEPSLIPLIPDEATRNLSMEIDESPRNSFMEIARSTGGFVFEVSSHERLFGAQVLPLREAWYDDDDRTREAVKLYTRMLRAQVNGFYTLRLDAALRPGKPGKIWLDVIDGRGKRKKDVEYTYSTTLMPQSN